MMLGASLVFTCLTLPSALLWIYKQVILYKEQAYSDPSMVQMTIDFVVACLQYLNHAVNLFVYTVRSDLRVKSRRFGIGKLKCFEKSKNEPNH